MSATAHLLTEIEASAHKWEPRLGDLEDTAIEEWQHVRSLARSLLFHVRVMGMIAKEIRAKIEAD